MNPLQTYHTAGHIFAAMGQIYTKPLHQHADACEVLLVASGTGIFTINGKSYRAGPGSIVLCNAGDWQEARVDPAPLSKRCTFPVPELWQKACRSAISVTSSWLLFNFYVSLQNCSRCLNGLSSNSKTEPCSNICLRCFSARLNAP
ncbi:AraC family ligand binding domain-containing protein [Planococcus koreensis]|uniref:AraC family ligand binding domain-containing protein n=1 Tax=Planococcus koreensis TaxID=112331 RepID=UPI0039FDC794